jgi:hypothetical protein
MKEPEPDRMRKSGLIVPPGTSEHPPQEGIVHAAGEGVDRWKSAGGDLASDMYLQGLPAGVPRHRSQPLQQRTPRGVGVRLRWHPASYSIDSTLASMKEASADVRPYLS